MEHLKNIFSFRYVFETSLALHLNLPSFLPNSWADSREVWENMLRKERDLPRDPYMLANHPELASRMRSVLLNWLLEVCDAYQLHRETFCLAVDFTDRYLSLTRGVRRTQLQLIGISALFLAAKQEEIYPPKVTEFAYVTDTVCSVRDILRQEMIIVKVLKWKLCPMTTNAWLGIFLQLVNANRLTDPNTGFMLPLFSNFSFVQMSRLCDLCLLDLGSLHFPYSNIAAAALVHHTRNEAILDVLNLNKANVAQCVNWMVPFAVALTEAGPSPVKSFPDVDMKEFHTLQTHNVDLDLLTHAVGVQMVYLEQVREQEVPLDLTKRQA
ncbi:unnamed protein product [Lymnaea stagnalis]|uniref:Cyclin N-terminal domain-containing protein n=1 Tax=Lymnaea stagnalis TaxID=6523 RepID=A0AAV2HYK6_LYMST